MSLLSLDTPARWAVPPQKSEFPLREAILPASSLYSLSPGGGICFLQLLPSWYPECSFYPSSNLVNHLLAGSRLCVRMPTVFSVVWLAPKLFCGLSLWKGLRWTGRVATREPETRLHGFIVELYLLTRTYPARNKTKQKTNQTPPQPNILNNICRGH